VKLFEYTAVDGRGTTVHGQADAESVLLLDRSLEDRGLVVTQVKVVERKPARVSSTRLSKDELVVFTTQVSTMLGAGVPILQGLKELKKRLRTERARSVVNRLIEDLEGGTSLAQAMSQQPRAFPDIYRASVGAGEMAGELPAVLKRMGGFLEWSRAVRAMETGVQLVGECVVHGKGAFHGARMQNLRTHTGQLQHLFIRCFGKPFGALHHSWIGGIDTVDIGINLACFGFERRRYNHG
jgi:hypothetical protein